MKNEIASPLVSVVVPVYNSETYIRDTIDALVNQTFDDYEILLVDDGSTDSTPIICDEYSVKYPKVKVYHKKNGGVSDARNYGLDKASGELITFADSDDYVLPEWIEYMVQHIKNYDLCICNYIQCDRDSYLSGTYSHSLEEQSPVYFTSKEDFKKNLGILDRFCYGAVWRQMFRKEIIDRYNIRFEKIQFEDVLFSYTYLLYASSVVKTFYEGYVYIHNLGSLSHTHKFIADYKWIKRMEAIHENLINKYEVHDPSYLEILQKRFSVHAACLIAKSYYKDTKLGYKQRMDIWKTLRNDNWFSKLNINLVDSKLHRFTLFVCKKGLYYLFDPIYVVLLKNH